MVEPRSPGVNVFSRYKLPRLGLLVLGTLAARRGYDVSVLIEERTGVDASLVAQADLLCISCTTSTAPAAYDLAYKARMAGVPVILGGPHPTFLPEEGLEYATSPDRPLEIIRRPGRPSWQRYRGKQKNEAPG